MTEHFWQGMAIIFFSGACNGSFALPMKYARRWRWENTWLVFAALSLMILPWVLAAGFVPRLMEVYREVSGRALFYPLLFGFVWGVAMTTYGVCIDMVGIALAIAVVAGLSCLFGSLIPLLVFNPADLVRPRGLLLLVSMPILFLGLILYSKAGRRRESEQASPQSAFGGATAGFKTGLAICIFTGIIGPSFNIGFAFSGDIMRHSLALGASPLTSTYAVWSLVLGAGFIPNLFYCLFLLLRHRGWSLFLDSGWVKETLLAVAMTLVWFTGIVSYGIGATLVGKYGTSVGFALFIAATILSSNLVGIVTGEWKNTSQGTTKLLVCAGAATLASVLVLNLGGLF